jgi:hypothetical protein
MDADIAFKVLFRTRLRDLLGLTGDQGARVPGTRVPEVQQRARRPDFVLKLRRRGQAYLRYRSKPVSALGGLRLASSTTRRWLRS